MNGGKIKKYVKKTFDYGFFVSILGFKTIFSKNKMASYDTFCII